MSMNYVFKIKAWAISFHLKRRVFSKEMQNSWISPWGERVRKGWLKKLKLNEVRLSSLFSHWRTSSNAKFFIKCSLIRQIRSGSLWTSAASMAGHEGKCLQRFDCDVLVAVTKYCLALFVIHLFIHSFIKHYWALTMSQLMEEAWKRVGGT